MSTTPEWLLEYLRYADVVVSPARMSFEDGTLNAAEISREALSVLRLYHAQGVTLMFLEDMVRQLPRSQPEVEATLEELLMVGLIAPNFASAATGPSYSLTVPGREALARGLPLQETQQEDHR